MTFSKVVELNRSFFINISIYGLFYLVHTLLKQFLVRLTLIVCFQVNDNVTQVYNKYVEEGKTTISFAEPPHNLVIQCNDVIQLKTFLRVLKLGLDKKTNLAVLPISNSAPKDITNILSNSQTKITIKERSKYPVLKGFPKTCRELYLAGLQRRSFDGQILKLQSLRVLDLSNNNLTTLPKEIGTLIHLASLNLAGNQLGKAPLTKWAWLASPNLAKSLCGLDISENQVSCKKVKKNVYCTWYSKILLCKIVWKLNLAATLVSRLIKTNVVSIKSLIF